MSVKLVIIWWIEMNKKDRTFYGLIMIIGIGLVAIAIILTV